MKPTGCVLIGALALAAVPSAYAANVDPALPHYRPRPVAPPADAGYVLPDGTIHIVAGNRGMGVVLEGFNALFSRTHPGTRFRIDYNREGNSVNITALTFGLTMVCPLGREMNWYEHATYRNVVAADPLVIRIAHGTLTSPRMTAGLAIYIHKDNPIRRLSIDQLAAMFTTGAPGGDLTFWGQVGGTGEWANRPIHIYGTPEASGYGYYMLKNKWGDRPFASHYESFELAEQIVKRVGQDLYGIGFAGQGFLTPETRLVAVADQANGEYLEGDEDDVASGRYALDRPVALAIRHEPGNSLDPFVVEYMRMILSHEGQEIVAAEQDGYVPLNAAQVALELAKLDNAEGEQGGRGEPAALADGSINIVGDATMRPLLARLDELYVLQHPGTRISLTLRATPTGIDGIIAGVSPFAPLARDAWETEIDLFKRLTGYRPLDIRVGRYGDVGAGRANPPAVYVNAANPLAQLTMNQVARIFTAGQRPSDLHSWSQVGLEGEWGKHAIHVYGPRDDGKFATALRQARFDGRPFARAYEALQSDSDVLEAVAGDRYGIGVVDFVDTVALPAHVRLVPLANDASATPSTANYEEVRQGRYALAPYLHFYLRDPATEANGAFVRDYLRLALSPEGQRVVEELRAHGFVPLPAAELKQELAKLERALR